MVEMPFEVEFDGVTVRGRIDRLDVEDGPGGKVYHVLDYKTRLSKAQKQSIGQNKQLLLYAAALADMYNFKGRVEGSLECVETGDRVSAPLHQEDIDATREEIITVAKAVRARKFDPTPGFFACKFCDFSHSCPDRMRSMAQR
eukprot:GFYU01042097.1.p1 GENE.GFYU01042097.1~~GFYU01042097.1.p1  ORF type:complete len:168 (-),score=10.06 GFYU01042097.1:170-598(-)